MRAQIASCQLGARRYGEDEETWGMVGILHDYDYEAFPDEHPYVGARLLREAGWPEEIVLAIASTAVTAVRTDPLTPSRSAHTAIARAASGVRTHARTVSTRIPFSAVLGSARAVMFRTLQPSRTRNRSA
jgi:predicted hydrolase (HD superfamily)